MKHRMVWLWLALLFCLAGIIPAYSQNNPLDGTDSATPSLSVIPTPPPPIPSPTPAAIPSPAVSAVPTPEATPEILHLKDKFAIGTDTLRVDENSTNFTSTPNTFTFSALDAIWWVSDEEAFDFLATGSTVSTVGVDFYGATEAYPTDIFAGGLGYRRNLSSPVRDLKIQALARVTYGRFTSQQELWYYAPANISFETGTLNSESLYLMAGLGFEYFMPFCESLSVQSYLAFAANYNDNSTSVDYNPNMPKYGYTGYVNARYSSWYWRTALILNGLNFSSLSIHFYF